MLLALFKDGGQPITIDNLREKDYILLESNFTMGSWAVGSIIFLQEDPFYKKLKIILNNKIAPGGATINIFISDILTKLSGEAIKFLTNE